MNPDASLYSAGIALSSGEEDFRRLFTDYSEACRYVRILLVHEFKSLVPDAEWSTDHPETDLLRTTSDDVTGFVEPEEVHTSAYGALLDADRPQHVVSDSERQAETTQ